MYLITALIYIGIGFGLAVITFAVSVIRVERREREARVEAERLMSEYASALIKSRIEAMNRRSALILESRRILRESGADMKYTVGLN